MTMTSDQIHLQNNNALMVEYHRRGLSQLFPRAWSSQSASSVPSTSPPLRYQNNDITRSAGRMSTLSKDMKSHDYMYNLVLPHWRHFVNKRTFNQPSVDYSSFRHTTTTVA